MKVLQLPSVLMPLLMYRSRVPSEIKQSKLSALQEKAIRESWSLRRWLLDTGPAAIQKSVPLSSGDTLTDLQTPGDIKAGAGSMVCEGSNVQEHSLSVHLSNFASTSQRSGAGDADCCNLSGRLRQLQQQQPERKESKELSPLAMKEDSHGSELLTL